jgi:hypothetical protein
MAHRRFPPPWSVEEGEAYFVVKDSTGQKLGYVYFDDPRSADKPLTRDKARGSRSTRRSCRTCCGSLKQHNDRADRR